jgi:hypothetical protein
MPFKVDYPSATETPAHPVLVVARNSWRGRVRPYLPYLLVLLGVLAAVASYLQAVNFQFVSDDLIYVADNHKLMSLQLAEVGRLLTERFNDYEFLPLRDFSYWLDMKISGTDPAVFRLHNILLYLLCLPLVYFATLNLWRYFRPAEDERSMWIAATVTALFAINPAHVEAVVWVSGSKDVLAGFFSMLAICLALKAKDNYGINGKWAAASMLMLAAAILSKGTAVMMAPVVAMFWLLFWLDVSPNDRKWSRLLWPAGVLLQSAGMAIVFAENSTIKDPTELNLGMADRAFTVTGNLFRVIVSPEARHFFYPGLDDPYHLAMLAGGVLILALSAAGAFLVLRRRSLAGCALVVFVLLCVPYMQFIPYRTPSLVVDRYVFLAVWPVTLLLVMFAWRFKPIFRNAILVILALLWCAQTTVRPREWFSAETMIEADVRSQPGYYMPLFQKIMWLQLKHGRYDEAHDAALQITDPLIRNNVVAMVESKRRIMVDGEKDGNPYRDIAGLGKFEDALVGLADRSEVNPAVRYIWKYSRFELADQWKYLAGIYPDDISARLNAGRMALVIDADYDAAISNFRAVAESQRLPDYIRGSVHKDLGTALLYAGRVREAEAELRSALSASPPDFRANCVLTDLYGQTGRTDEAVRANKACNSRFWSEVSAR